MTEPNTDLPPDFDLEEFRRRQRSRSRIMAVALLGLVVLFFFITMARIGLAH
jgi:hypothetical protein